MEMDMLPLISVIMPVYNVEKYLGKAIDSVLAQRFTDFELILVDDGSTDRSSELCDSYAGLPNVTVLHLPHSGVANARNTGLRHARGKYIAFFDSDDFVEQDMLSKMVAQAEKSGSEIVVAGFHMKYMEDGRKLDYPVADEDAVYNIEDFQRVFYRLLRKNLLNTPWNKLYLKRFLQENKAEFPDRLCEDVYFNLDLYAHIRKISVISAPLYHWFRSRPDSETAKIYASDLLWQTKRDVYKALLDLCGKWKVSGNLSYMADITCYYTDRLVQCIQEIMANRTDSYRKKRQYIRTILDDPLTRNAIKTAKPSGMAMKICYLPLRLRNVMLCAWMGSAITFIKTNFTKLFYDLRSGEVNDSRNCV